MPKTAKAAPPRQIEAGTDVIEAVKSDTQNAVDEPQSDADLDDFFAWQQLARLELPPPTERQGYGRVLILAGDAGEARAWAAANDVRPRDTRFASTLEVVRSFVPNTVVRLPGFESKRNRFAIDAEVKMFLRSGRGRRVQVIGL